MAEAQVVPTLRQERLAAALENPAITTKKAAALAAGYSLSTATSQPGKVTGAIGVLAARERLSKLARRSDKALELKERSIDAIIAKIENDSASDALLAAGAKVGHDISQDSPAEESGDATASLLKYRRAIHLAFLFGYIAAKRVYEPQDVVLSPRENAPIENSAGVATDES